MVGAKEFSMRRNINPQKENPLLKAIKLPSFMKSHEVQLNKTDPSLYKPKAQIFSLHKMLEKITRIGGEHNTPEVEMSHAPKAESAGNVKRAPFLKASQHYDNSKEDISDELANRITYKVLKNIKSYLNNPSQVETERRHIKLEISL